jgi:hypothetical protein
MKKFTNTTNVGKPQAQVTSLVTSKTPPPQYDPPPVPWDSARASDLGAAPASHNPARDAAARRLAAVMESRADAQADELQSMLEDVSMESPSLEDGPPAGTGNPTKTLANRNKKYLACERTAWEHRPKVSRLSN